MMTTPNNPIQRPRRLRLSDNMRRLVRETVLSPSDFIYPLFVCDGEGIINPIPTMPNQFQYSVDQLADEIRTIVALNIPAVIVFGIPQHKDAHGSDNFNPNGVIPRAIRQIKQIAPDLIVISDMCCCEYTTHGHCGIINTPDSPFYQPHMPHGYLLNDPTLTILARASVVHAQAGADVIAPSGMIDGMVGAIRGALDEAGFAHTTIMSYAAKYASGFYGPFRVAVDSAPSFGDRAQYQMDGANAREAYHEVALDVQQGADIIMVKPALPYLDIIHGLRGQYHLPIAAYQVSGEYAMIHAAAQQGWLDLRRTALETLTSIKRAGADMILTYFAKDAVKWIDG